MAIHDGHRERMRKQLKTSGMDSLSDVQVLEVLLYYAAPRGDTNPAAHALLNRFGTLDGCLPEFVLAALRELPAGVTLPREDADKLWKDQIQLAACIASLDDDGLIEILDGGLRLPS